MKLRTKIFIMVLGCVLAALIIQTCLFQNLSSKLIYEQAKEESLNAKFFCQDIRTITFDKGYDVVLNMADGAIGYLEDDEENHKIFSVIAKALKNGGKHFMDIINGSVFENHNGRHLLPFFT